jgi:excisionase family DNA binding protein
MDAHITLSEARERGAITVEQAAHLLGIGRAIAYQSVNDGTIPSVRLGRRIVVPVSALLNFLDQSPG